MTQGKCLTCPPVKLVNSPKNNNSPDNQGWENIGPILASILAKAIKADEKLDEQKKGNEITEDLL